MEHHSIEAVMERLDGSLDAFDRIARQAHATYRAYNPLHLVEHSPRAQAACIYDHMVAEATRLFDGNPKVRPLELNGLLLWAFEDHTLVRFKKMDEDGRSRNYPTRQAIAFDRQYRLEGVPPEPSRITVGYLLDETKVELVRVQVARPGRRGVDWCAAIVPVDARAASDRKWEDVTRQLRFG